MNLHFKQYIAAILLILLGSTGRAQDNDIDLQKEMEAMQLALEELKEAETKGLQQLGAIEELNGLNQLDDQLRDMTRPAAPHRKLVEQSKTLHHEANNITPGTEIRISNKFGDVNVTTWNENKVVIDVEITVRHGNDKRVQKRLDEITVDFRSDADIVQAITNIACDNVGLKLSFGASIETHINYTVKMPKANPIRVKNRFGNVYLPDLDGRTTMDVGYGSLIARNLLNEKNDMRLLFARNSRIDMIKSVDMDLEYSGLAIEKVGTLDVTSKFSDLEVEKVEDLNGDSQYDKLNIVYVRNLNLDSKFSTVKIKEVHKEVKVDNAYGYFKIDQINKDFTTCRIINEFAKFRVGFQKGASINLDVSTQFAGFDYPSTWNLNVNKYNDQSSYAGKVNGGKTLVTIRSKYGNVELYMP